MLYETKFLVSLILTLFIEVPIVLIFLNFILPKIKLYKKLLIPILATSLTLPYLWFIFPIYIEYPFYIILGEVTVFLIESLIYWQFLPINLKKAMIISFVANISSFFFGLLLF
ncbi:MAG: hypothetical protein QXW97_04355 [Candidatus Pacearchaeota archaeon]